MEETSKWIKEKCSTRTINKIFKWPVEVGHKVTAIFFISSLARKPRQNLDNSVLTKLCEAVYTSSLTCVSQWDIEKTVLVSLGWDIIKTGNGKLRKKTLKWKICLIKKPVKLGIIEHQKGDTRLSQNYRCLVSQWSTWGFFKVLHTDPLEDICECKLLLLLYEKDLHSFQHQCSQPLWIRRGLFCISVIVLNRLIKQ